MYKRAAVTEAQLNAARRGYENHLADYESYRISRGTLPPAAAFYGWINQMRRAGKLTDEYLNASSPYGGTNMEQLYRGSVLSDPRQSVDYSSTLYPANVTPSGRALGTAANSLPSQFEANFNRNLWRNSQAVPIAGSYVGKAPEYTFVPWRQSQEDKRRLWNYQATDVASKILPLSVGVGGVVGNLELGWHLGMKPALKGGKWALSAANPLQRYVKPASYIVSDPLKGSRMRLQQQIGAARKPRIPQAPSRFAGAGAIATGLVDRGVKDGLDVMRTNLLSERAANRNLNLSTTNNSDLLTHLATPEKNRTTGDTHDFDWSLYYKQLRQLGGDDLVRAVLNRRENIQAPIDYKRDRNALAGLKQRTAQQRADVSRGLNDTPQAITGPLGWLGGTLGNTGTWVDFLPSKSARDWYWNRQAANNHKSAEANSSTMNNLSGSVENNRIRMENAKKQDKPFNLFPTIQRKRVN